jgi:hypothetical protein
VVELDGRRISRILVSAPTEPTDDEAPAAGSAD